MEPGSLPPLSLSLIGLQPEAPPRSRIMVAAELGYRSVTLDAASPGLRPRELDRSARRDLASSLRRAELRLGGLDLWIPSAHWSHPQHADRAVAAGVAAIELLGELAALTPTDAVLGLLLPGEGIEEVERVLAAAADGAGVLIADHRWPVREGQGPLCAGLDPVMVLSEKADPVGMASRSSVVSARLASLGDAVVRVALDDASSRLDLMAYRASLSIAPSLRTVVSDVRGLFDPVSGAGVALEAWADAALG